MELVQWLWKKKISQKQMAEDLDVERITLNTTVSHKRTPHLELALAIFHYTEGKVELETLLSPKDKQKLEERLKKINSLQNRK